MKRLGVLYMSLAEWFTLPVPPPKVPATASDAEWETATKRVMDERARFQQRTDGAYTRAQLLTAVEIAWLAVAASQLKESHVIKVAVLLSLCVTLVGIVVALLAARPRMDSHKNWYKFAEEAIEFDAPKYYLLQYSLLCKARVRLRWRHRQLQLATWLTVSAVALTFIAKLPWVVAQL